MELEVVDLAAACRTCLKVGRKQISIFSEESKVNIEIEYCTGVTVRADDGLPSAICHRCRRQLRVAFQFVRKCRETNQLLLKIWNELGQPVAPVVNAKTELEESDDVKKEITEESNVKIKLELESGSYLPDASSDSKDCNDDIAECSAEFGDPQGLSKPISKIKIKKEKKKKLKKGKNVCSTCGVSAQSQAALAIHLRTHTGERPFVCHHCGGCFAQKSTLQVHIARRHSPVKLVREKKFKCETCGKNYTTSTNLKIHVRIHTGETPFACTMCSAKFTQVGPLLAHRRRHFGEKPHKCETCGKRFGERSHLLRHRSVHTDDRPFKCTICGVSLKSSYALKMHIGRHSGDKPHVCDKCGTAFKSAGSLKSHTRNMHSERSGWCTSCQKPFSDLAEHSLVHSGEKRYPCSMCDARFAGRRGLAVHLRQHSVPDFACSIEGCAQVFRRRWQLDSHLLKKHSTREHVCRSCCQGFIQADQLTEHMNLKSCYK